MLKYFQMLLVVGGVGRIQDHSGFNWHGQAVQLSIKLL